jgi:GTPase SAR1 family protein
MSRYERAIAAFDEAIAATTADPALRAVRDTFIQQRQRYLRTMSVALVGRVSSGKSTLANALLGGDFAPTGIAELTCNVTWLRYGPGGQITVHFADGRPPEKRRRDVLGSLAALARDDPAMRDYLTAIGYLEVTEPNPMLEAFDLIDTPGLDAASGGAQERKTLAFLGRTPERVHADSIDFASRADALIIVFPKALAAHDAELVADFTQAGFGAANPITAVGVLTKVDTSWPGCAEPMAEARRRAEGILSAPHARSLMFDLKPLAGKMAAAAGVLSERDFADLSEFRDLGPGPLVDALRFAPAFAKAPYPELPLPAERRDELLRMLGGYGFYTACESIRAGVAGPAELRRTLAERSGLDELRQLLTDHFARRTEVIKLRRAVEETSAFVRRLDGELTQRALDQARRAAAPVTDLADEPAFRGLAALRDYHQGLLVFTAAEGEELTRAIGERGQSLTDRLGVPPGTAPADLAAIVANRLRYWSKAVQGPFYPGASRIACQVMQSAYDQISHELAGTRGNR